MRPCVQVYTILLIWLIFMDAHAPTTPLSSKRRHPDDPLDKDKDKDKDGTDIWIPEYDDDDWQHASPRFRRDTSRIHGPKLWDQWGRWSACSVTCGKGKVHRWRHCVGGGCADGEKEAQIKECILPACK